MGVTAAKAGRYGGTYAHRDIAFEFGMAISPASKVHDCRQHTRSFLSANSLLFSFNLIDSFIDEHASLFGGFEILIFLLYPIMLPLYSVLMWMVDCRMAKTMRNR